MSWRYRRNFEVLGLVEGVCWISLLGKATRGGGAETGENRAEMRGIFFYERMRCSPKCVCVCDCFFKYAFSRRKCNRTCQKGGRGRR